MFINNQNKQLLGNSISEIWIDDSSFRGKLSISKVKGASSEMKNQENICLNLIGIR